MWFRLLLWVGALCLAAFVLQGAAHPDRERLLRSAFGLFGGGLPTTRAANRPPPTKRKVTALTKKMVAARQGWRCDACRALLDYSFQVDHVKPLYQGGGNDPSNIPAAVATASEWMKKRLA